MKFIFFTINSNKFWFLYENNPDQKESLTYPDNIMIHIVHICMYIFPEPYHHCISLQESCDLWDSLKQSLNLFSTKFFFAKFVSFFGPNSTGRRKKYKKFFFLSSLNPRSKQNFSSFPKNKKSQKSILYRIIHLNITNFGNFVRYFVR